MAKSVSFYSPEGQKKLQELQRQQLLAQMLMGSGRPVQREQTRIVPRESALTHLVPVAQQMLGAYVGNKAQKGEQELQAAEYAKILERMGGSIPNQPMPGSQPPAPPAMPPPQGAQPPLLPPEEQGVQLPGAGPSAPGFGANAPGPGLSTPGIGDTIGAGGPGKRPSLPLNPYGIDPVVAAQAYMDDPAKYAGFLMDANKPTDLERNLGNANFTDEQRREAYAHALLPGDRSTDDQREYAAAVKQGYQGTLEQWILSGKRAGASNVSVNTEKSLYGSMGDEQAKANVALYAQAQAAPDAISRARRVREILDANPYTGAAADWKLAIGKASKAAGFDYAGDDIANTELLTRELGQNALDNVKSSGLAGSQGLTEGERKFLMAVVGGTIELDANTLRRVADLNERVARNSVLKWNSTVDRLKPEQMSLLGMQRVEIPEAEDPSLVGGLPNVGAVMKGDNGISYEFLGGDPANPKNWRKQ